VPRFQLPSALGAHIKRRRQPLEAEANLVGGGVVDDIRLAANRGHVDLDQDDVYQFGQIEALENHVLLGSATNLSDRQAFSDRLWLLFDEERDLDVPLRVAVAVLDTDDEPRFGPTLTGNTTPCRSVCLLCRTLT